MSVAMMLTENDIDQKKRDSPSGVSAFFIQVNDTIGIKCYHSDNNSDPAGERDHCFEMQQRAWNVDIGPQAYECFQIGDYFCYSTQIAHVVMSHAWGSYYGLHVVGGKDIHVYEILNQIFKEELDELLEACEAEFGEHDDLHLRNVGWLNGSLVCIDFGSDGIHSSDCGW